MALANSKGATNRRSFIMGEVAEALKQPVVAQLIQPKFATRPELAQAHGDAWDWLNFNG